MKKRETQNEQERAKANFFVSLYIYTTNHHHHTTIFDQAAQPTPTG